jgi:hypothetical protein
MCITYLYLYEPSCVYVLITNVRILKLRANNYVYAVISSTASTYTHTNVRIYTRVYEGANLITDTK